MRRASSASASMGVAQNVTGGSGGGDDERHGAGVRRGRERRTGAAASPTFEPRQAGPSALFAGAPTVCHWGHPTRATARHTCGERGARREARPDASRAGRPPLRFLRHRRFPHATPDAAPPDQRRQRLGRLYLRRRRPPQGRQEGKGQGQVQGGACVRPRGLRGLMRRVLPVAGLCLGGDVHPQLGPGPGGRAREPSGRRRGPARARASAAVSVHASHYPVAHGPSHTACLPPRARSGARSSATSCSCSICPQRCSTATCGRRAST
jgi:hypothetical protein